MFKWYYNICINYILFFFDPKKTGLSMKSFASGSKLGAGTCSVNEQQIFTKVGLLKGVLCAVKKIQKAGYKPSRMDLIELKNVSFNYNCINIFTILHITTILNLFELKYQTIFILSLDVILTLNFSIMSPLIQSNMKAT